MEQKWYLLIDDEPVKTKEVSAEIVDRLKDQAKTLYYEAVNDYKKKNKKEMYWKSSLIESGTLHDKIASLTVLIQDNPLFSIDSIQKLMALINIGKRKECTKAIDNLPELFAETLLKPDTRLLRFEEHPLHLVEGDTDAHSSRNKWLISWYFEDKLSEIHWDFVSRLKTLTHHSLESNRERSLKAVFYLLINSNEKLSTLIECAVNKLGDRSKKLVSKLLYYFKQFLHRKPEMKVHVLNETEKILFRPNIDKKCQHYAICLLASFDLKPSDLNITHRLIDIYFAFFKTCIKQGDIETKLLQILLNGVSKACQANRSQAEKIKEHIDTLYKIVHLSRIGISLNTLNLLYETLDLESAGGNDRFYSAIYRVMLRPELLTSTHQFTFLSITLRALNADRDSNRIRAFIKRLLEIAISSTPAFSCAILFVVSQIIAAKSDLLEDLHRIRMANIVPINKRKNADVSGDEVAVKNRKKIKLENGHAAAAFDSDIKPLIDDERDEQSKPFDYFYRNPKYAGAQNTFFSELLFLQNSYHPSVALFAKTILNDEQIQYDGNPLEDFLLSKFMDKFAFKNVSKKKMVKQSKNSLPILSEEYVSRPIEEIPTDERFLLQYLKVKNKQKQKRAENAANDDNSDNESVTSEDFDREISSKLGISMKSYDFSKHCKKPNKKKAQD